MSDNQTPNGAQSTQDGAQDPIQNLKGEFNRKLGSMSDQLTALTEANKVLLAKLESASKPPAPPQRETDVDEEKLLFERPKDFISKLRQEVRGVVSESIGDFQQQATQQNQTLASLYDQYPELNNPGSDLTKKTLENLQSMSKEEQRNPKMLRVAALEAAADLGVQPKKRRTMDDAEISFKYSANKTSDRELPKTMRQAEQSMLSLAAAMGLNVNDKKVVDELKQSLRKQVK